MKKNIFLGYGEESESYSLYNPVLKKFVLNRDPNSLRIKHGVRKEMQQWIGKIHSIKLMN